MIARDDRRRLQSVVGRPLACSSRINGRLNRLGCSRTDRNPPSEACCGMRYSLDCIAPLECSRLRNRRVSTLARERAKASSAKRLPYVHVDVSIGPVLMEKNAPRRCNLPLELHNSVPLQLIAGNVRTSAGVAPRNVAPVGDSAVVRLSLNRTESLVIAWANVCNMTVMSESLV